MSDRRGSSASWTFLTNHAHVLLAIAREPQSTMREIAGLVGITERATQTIVADLVAGGYLVRSRTGRRNSYQIAARQSMRHPLNRGHDVDELLTVLLPDRGRPPTDPAGHTK